MLVLIFLIKNIIDFYVMLLLLIIWMYLVNCNLNNIIAQFLLKTSSPLINLFNKIFYLYVAIEIKLPCLVLILTILKCFLLLSIQVKHFYFNPINLLFCFLSLLKSIGNLIFWLIIIKSLRSAFNQKFNEVDQLLIQLTKPIIRPIKLILPNIGNIDFSSILIIVIIYTLNLIGINTFPNFWSLL